MSSNNAEAEIPTGEAESILTPDQVPTHLPTVTHCLNCETEITGNFCSNCGQEATDRNVRIWSLLKEIIGDYAGFDSVFFRTFKALFASPGHLTEAYNAGQRVRYLLPPRLYLLMSILFFFIMTNFDPVMVDDLYTDDEVELRLQETGTPRPMLEERFQQKMESSLALGMLFVIPFLALAMKLLYIRSKRYLVEHLIFSFHFISFLFLAWLPGALFANQILYGIGFVGALVYLFIAIRRVYKQSILLTVLKTLLLFTYFSGILLFYIVFFLAIAFERSL